MKKLIYRILNSKKLWNFEQNVNKARFAIQNRDFTKALIFSSNAIELIPHLEAYFEKEKLASAFYNKGYAYLGLKKKNEAYKFYVKTLEYKPDKIEALHDLGVLKLDEGLYTDAKDFFMKVLSLNNSFGKAHYNLGRVFLKTGNKSSAIESFVKAQKFIPKDIKPILYIGIIYFEDDELVKAKDMFDSAKSLVDNNKYLSLLKTVMEIELGNNDVALKSWLNAHYIASNGAGL